MEVFLTRPTCAPMLIDSWLGSRDRFAVPLTARVLQCLNNGFCFFTEEPMPKSSFLAIFQGYFCRASIHAIRLYLGKQVDGEILSLNVRSCIFVPLLHDRLGSDLS